MKISLIISSFYPAISYGGPIISTLHTCKELVKLDNVEVFVSTTNTNMTKKLEVETNKFLELEKDLFVKYYDDLIIDKFSLQFLLNINKDIKNADIVHLQGVFNLSSPITLIISHIYKKKLVLSPRGCFGSWCLQNGSRFKKIWLTLLIKPFANKITWHATSSQEKNEIISIYPNAFVEIIPNGVEYDLFQNKSLLTKINYINFFTSKNIAVDKLIVSMGRIQKKKGFDILIDAFHGILNSYPLAKLLIAGEDEGELENLLQKIISLRLEDKVFFIGNVSDQNKINFLSNADLFVLSSHNENFGNVYLESLAAGTPIVATKNTPWEEVEIANCGKWVNNNALEIEGAMRDMLQVDGKIAGCNARGLAKKYDWKIIAMQFKELFTREINK